MSKGILHGAPFVCALSSALWYIDGHHHTLKEAGFPVPEMFSGFSGFNIKAQKEVYECKDSKTACHCFEGVSFDQLD